MRECDTFPDFELIYESQSQTAWLTVRPTAPVRATASFVQQLTLAQAAVARRSVEADPMPVRFCVTSSALPGIYNFGGDLPFFVDCVRRRDREALLHYAHACVRMIHNNCVGWGTKALTLALVQGDALGGGFESVISHDFVVAERGARMGMPEILFNTFPGMGAFSFLRRKLDAVRAERMILSGKIYSASELFDMGLVDVLAEEGRGRDEARRFISDARRYDVLRSVKKVRERIHPLEIDEMMDITDIWVENVMNIHASDLRRMEHLVAAQMRRLAPLQTS